MGYKGLRPEEPLNFCEPREAKDGPDDANNSKTIVVQWLVLPGKFAKCCGKENSGKATWYH